MPPSVTVRAASSPCTRGKRRSSPGRLVRPLLTSLGHTAFPYVFLDARYVNVRVDDQVVSRAVVIAASVTAQGGREVLGLDVGGSEDAVFWPGFLTRA